MEIKRSRTKSIPILLLVCSLKNKNGELNNSGTSGCTKAVLMDCLEFQIPSLIYRFAAQKTEGDKKVKSQNQS